MKTAAIDTSGSRPGRTKGLVCAMVSGATFGMMPLFSIPALEAGMSTFTVVAYRFLLGTAAMLAMLLVCRQSLRVTFGEIWRITVLAVLNIVSAVTLIYGYNLMPSGAATTVQFSHPIFTCVLLMLFFRERPRVLTVVAILLAVLGVAAISDFDGDGDMSLYGVAIELLSGLAYSFYMILVPKFRLQSMDSTKLTFYVFLVSTLLMVAVALAVDGTGQATLAFADKRVAFSLLLLGIIPTALSNITLTIGLRNVGSTITSTLSALEPLVAIIIGLAVFSEPFSMLTLVGFVCITAAVTLLIFDR